MLLFLALLIDENTVSSTLMSRSTAATVRKPSFIRRVFVHTSRKTTSRNSLPAQAQQISVKEKLHRKSSLLTQRLPRLQTTTRLLLLLLLQMRNEFAKRLTCFQPRFRCKCGTRQWDTLINFLLSTPQLIILDIIVLLSSTLRTTSHLSLLFHLCTNHTTNE